MIGSLAFYVFFLQLFTFLVSYLIYSLSTYLIVVTWSEVSSVWWVYAFHLSIIVYFDVENSAKVSLMNRSFNVTKLMVMMMMANRASSLRWHKAMRYPMWLKKQVTTSVIVCTVHVFWTIPWIMNHNGIHLSHMDLNCFNKLACARMRIFT